MLVQEDDDLDEKELVATEKAGKVTLDARQFLIAYPCYLLPRQCPGAKTPQSLVLFYSAFTEMLTDIFDSRLAQMSSASESKDAKVSITVHFKYIKPFMMCKRDWARKKCRVWAGKGSCSEERVIHIAGEPSAVGQTEKLVICALDRVRLMLGARPLSDRQRALNKKAFAHAEAVMRVPHLTLFHGL